MKLRLRRVWDFTSIYLPVMLMGLLALGTWWLVRNAPQPLLAPVAQALRHEVDYFMKDFSVQHFDATGRLQSEVQGTLAQHYPDTDTLHIDQVRMRSLAPDGRLTRATAHRAVSNADGSEVQLFGNAVVTREAQTQPGGKVAPQLEFRGEFLHVWPQTERVRSDQPVILTRGSDRFTGDTLEYDNVEQVLALRGRVHGVIMPAR